MGRRQKAVPCRRQKVWKTPGVEDVIDESRFPPVNIVQAKKLSTLVFDPEIIKGKNSAAAGLCEYVINITYHDIVVDVKRSAGR